MGEGNCTEMLRCRLSIVENSVFAGLVPSESRVGGAPCRGIPWGLPKHWVRERKGDPKGQVIGCRKEI